MEERLKKLYSNDENEANKSLEELENVTSECILLYDYFDQILPMLNDKNNIIKLRGYLLICDLSKWDKKHKINENINQILTVFDIKDQIILRHCIQKTNLLLFHIPELKDIVINKLENIDLKSFEENEVFLINSDINNLLRGLNE